MFFIFPRSSLSSLTVVCIFACLLKKNRKWLDCSFRSTAAKPLDEAYIKIKDPIKNVLETWLVALNSFGNLPLEGVLWTNRGLLSRRGCCEVASVAEGGLRRGRLRHVACWMTLLTLSFIFLWLSRSWNCWLHMNCQTNPNCQQFFSSKCKSQHRKIKISPKFYAAINKNRIPGDWASEIAKRSIKSDIFLSINVIFIRVELFAFHGDKYRDPREPASRSCARDAGFCLRGWKLVIGVEVRRTINFRLFN